MAFSKDTIAQAWKRAGNKYPPGLSYCECRRVTHDHGRNRCYKQVIWENRGGWSRGKWEAHSISGLNSDSVSDCEILCWNCIQLTLEAEHIGGKQSSVGA
jgi:hypothetical protein